MTRKYRPTSDELRFIDHHAKLFTMNVVVADPEETRKILEIEEPAFIAMLHIMQQEHLISRLVFYEGRAMPGNYEIRPQMVQMQREITHMMRKPDHAAGIRDRARAHRVLGPILGVIEVFGPFVGLVGGIFGIVAFLCS